LNHTCGLACNFTLQGRRRYLRLQQHRHGNPELRCNTDIKRMFGALSQNEPAIEAVRLRYRYQPDNEITNPTISVDYLDCDADRPVAPEQAFDFLGSIA
jgi:hypothetical protein